MENLENLVVSFRSKMGELGCLFDTVVSHKTDRPPHEIVVGQNEGLIVRIGMVYWACPLSLKECNFLQELLKSGGKMDGNNIKQWGLNLSNDKSIRNFLLSINRKLAAKKMPVRLHFIDWTIFIKLTSP